MVKGRDRFTLQKDAGFRVSSRQGKGRLSFRCAPSFSRFSSSPASGGLVDEVVWIRVAGTVIGNTTFAIGTVVGVFMGGLRLGPGGRAPGPTRQGAALLRLYGLLEGGIALSALAVPLLIAASEPCTTRIWNSSADHAFMRPSASCWSGRPHRADPLLMGATLPVLTRYLSDSGRAAAGEAGRA